MEELQTLISEKAKDSAVELSSLFEGLDLSDELKESLQATFDTAVKAASVQLVTDVLQEREKQIEEKYTKEAIELTEEIDQKYKDRENTLVESTQIYLDEFLNEWVENNKIAIDNSIKAKLFDSMFEGLSNIFVEHNLNVPTEEINIMDELQEDVDELQEKVDSLMKQNKSLQTQLKEHELKEMIVRLTEGLTQTQIEKVQMLSESIVIDDNVEQKLRTIIRMVESSTKDDDEEDPEDQEQKDKNPPKDQEIKESLNYNPGKPTNENSGVMSYLKYV